MKLDLQYFSSIVTQHELHTGGGGATGANKKIYRNNAKHADKSAKKARKVGKKASKSKQSSSSSSSNGPSAATRNSWETGTGIAFMGQMSAQIVHDVMYKFILGDADLNNNTGKVDLMYRYNVGNNIVGLRNLIDMDIPDDAGEWIAKTHNRYNIFNPDECCNADPIEYLQFEGNLMDYINSLSNQPFNEVYWTHEEEDDHKDAIGPIQQYAMKHDVSDPDTNQSKYNRAPKKNIPHATLHYRQTPFEPNQWFQLPKLYINDNDIISYQINNNDDEEYSVYNITNSGAALSNISNMPPVTDDHEELQRHYGYNYMDITSEYFMNTKSQVDMSTTDLVNAISRQDEDTQTGLAGLGYPSYETFECYFGPDSASQVLKNRDPILMAYLPMSNILGGSNLYHEATSILETHLQQYAINMLQYNVEKMLITYQEANEDTADLNAYRQQVGKNAKVPGSVSSPLDLPAGYAGRNNGFNQVYQDWQTNLADLRDMWQRGRINTSNGLENDLIKLVRSPDNVVKTPIKKETVSKDDRVITLQKAGQLAMKYMLSLSTSSKAINGFLSNPGVIALNPWLGKVENKGSKSSKSKSKKKSHKSKKITGATGLRTFGGATGD